MQDFQDLLTTAATITEFAFLALPVIHIVKTALRRAKPQTITPATNAAPIMEPITETVTPAPALPDPWEAPIEPVEPMEAPTPIYPSVPYLLLLPPAKEQPQALPTTIRELRKLCQTKGFKGAGRWSKDRCVQALTA